MSRAVLLIVRVGSALALILVATLYLLASIPFAYYHFLQFPHFWWMPAFIRLHPLVMLAAVTALVPTLRDLPDGLRRWPRYVGIGGVTASTCMGMTLAWPVISTYEVSAALYFMPILVLGVVGALDLVARRAAVCAVGRRDDSRSVVLVAALGGSLSAACYLLRSGLLVSEQRLSLQPMEIVVAVGASLVGHLGVFVAAALAILAPRAVSRRCLGLSPWGEHLSVLAGTTLVAAIVIRRVLLTSLTMDDTRAVTIALSLAAALVLYGSALVVRFESTLGARGDAPLLVEQPSSDKGRWIALAWMAVGVLCVVILPGALRLADWGTTLQELVVCVAWTASVGLLSQLHGGNSARFSAVAVLALFSVGAAATTVAARQPGAEPSARRRPLDIELAIERYATVDMSLRVVLDLVRPTVTDTQFFFDLEHVGDVTDDRAIRAVPMQVVERPGSGSPHPPNIFIFVVDSLRPDYLSAYNPDVAFTPAIGAFAAESVVMRHAFAPYTGTALSEPALWAGGMIPRRMYVQPFSTVNNLERLAALGGYRQYISVDEILGVILGDTSHVVRLDAHLAHPERRDEMFKFDLCTTQKELVEQIDRDKGRPGPVLAFTQAQSLHIRVLSGDRYPQYDGVPSGASTFFKPAVAALSRIDACFGQFVGALKARGLYEDSIVILTSDHGDYYGEDGRWGHAFYVGPQTVRIPLIMHVPRALLEGRRSDPQTVAMLTDVTPTLYALLGYGPVAQNGIVGRPLFVAGTEPPPNTDSDVYLMQSSYSRIFGLLGGHGQWLYTASANQVREELFDLRGDQPKAQPMHQAERLQYRKWLLERIARVNAYYRPQ
jgi:hypothetical protein